MALKLVFKKFFYSFSNSRPTHNTIKNFCECGIDYVTTKNPKSLELCNY